MLVGNISGQVYWIPNEGTRTSFKFGARRRLMAGGSAFTVGGGDAHPVATDWDRDGTLDLLIGCGDGSILFCKGEKKSASGPPTLQPGVKVEAGGKPVALGMRVKLSVHDWNEDGLPDLLAGNFGMEERSRQATVNGRPGYFGHVYVFLRQP